MTYTQVEKTIISIAKEFPYDTFLTVDADGTILEHDTKPSYNYSSCSWKNGTPIFEQPIKQKRKYIEATNIMWFRILEGEVVC